MTKALNIDEDQVVRGDFLALLMSGAVFKHEWQGSLCPKQEEESLVRGKKEEEDWKIEQDKTGARTRENCAACLSRVERGMSTGREG